MSNLLRENNTTAQRVFWDGRRLESFHGTEAFKARFLVDASTYQHGVGGAGNFNVSSNKAGEITVNGHQCALEELQFMESYDPRLPGNAGRVFDVSWKDLATGRTIIGRKCKIKTMPEYTAAEEATARVFVLTAHELIVTPGV